MDNATKYYTCHIKITKITKKNYETIGLNIYYINHNLTKIKSTLEII